VGTDWESEGVMKGTWLQLLRSCALCLLRCSNLTEVDREFGWEPIGSLKTRNRREYNI
jgi:hypothetical protein